MPCLHLAICQVLEEDPLFPAGKTLRSEKERISNIRSLLTPAGERMRADSAATAFTATTSFTSQTQSSRSNLSGSAMNITTEHSFHSSSLDSYFSTSSEAESIDSMYSQDHENLKRAWEKMLDQRFLTHKLTTVLPLYLTSFFKNVQVHPTMYIMLPPPSWERGPEFMADDKFDLAQDDGLEQWVRDMRSEMVRIDGDPARRKSTTAALRARPSFASVTMWNTLHLSRQVRVVEACKEAIWEAYQALAMAASPGTPAAGEPPRDEFEREWLAWEM